MKKLIKPRVIIKGDTVYELSRGSNTPRKIVHGADLYFKRRDIEEKRRLPEEEQELLYHEEQEEEPEEEYMSPRDKRAKLLGLFKGNTKKSAITTQADGLDREIAVDETEHEPIKKKGINDRYRKNKPMPSKAGRKINEFYGVKTNIGKKAGTMLTTVYRKKKGSKTKPKRKCRCKK